LYAKNEKAIEINKDINSNPLQISSTLDNLVLQGEFKVRANSLLYANSLSILSGAHNLEIKGLNVIGGEKYEREDSSGKYMFHVFTQTGVELGLRYLQANNTEFEILIVAGGGSSRDSGTWSQGAGGGAGGVIFKKVNLLPKQTFISYVGKGGESEENGEDSYLGELVAIGGGMGGGHWGSGLDGGSGGGEVRNRGFGKAIDPSQGNDGGESDNRQYAAGGGGYSEKGANANGRPDNKDKYFGKGGDGIDLTEWLIGLPFGDDGWFAGGGGGGGGITRSIGGKGGGGAGGKNNSSSGRDGLPNTGGGGGGKGFRVGYGSGGSGIIIVKYKLT
jgi:hypothetical protein